MVFGFFKKDKDKEAKEAPGTVSPASGEKSLFTGDHRVSAEIDFGFGTFTWDDSDGFGSEKVAPPAMEDLPDTETPMGVVSEDSLPGFPPDISPETHGNEDFPPPVGNLPDNPPLPGMDMGDTEPVINMEAMMMGPQPQAPETPPVDQPGGMDTPATDDFGEPDFTLETPPQDFGDTGVQDFGMDAPATGDFGAPDFTLETPPQDFGDMGVQDFGMDAPATGDFGAPDFTLETPPQDFGDTGAQDFGMDTPATGDFGEPDFPLETPSQDFGDMGVQDFGMDTPATDDFGAPDFTLETPPQDFGDTGVQDFGMDAPATDDDFGAPDFTLETPSQDFGAMGAQDFGMDAPATGDFGEPDFTLETPPQDFGDMGVQDFGLDTPATGDFGEPDFTLEMPPQDFGDMDVQDFGLDTPATGDFGAPDFSLETPPQDFGDMGAQDFGMDTPATGDFGEPDFTLETPSQDFGDMGVQDFGMDTPATGDDFGEPDFTLETPPQDFGDMGVQDFGMDAPATDDDFGAPGTTYSLESQFTAEIESARAEEPEFNAGDTPTWELSANPPSVSEEPPDLSSPVQQEDAAFMPDMADDNLSWMPEPQGFQDFSVSMGDDFYDHAAPGFDPAPFEDTADDNPEDALLEETLLHVDGTLYPDESDLDPTDLSGMIPNQDPFTAELPDMGLDEMGDSVPFSEPFGESIEASPDEPILDLSPHLGEDIEAIERANQLLEASLNEPPPPIPKPEDEEPVLLRAEAESLPAEATDTEDPEEGEDFTVLDSCPISEESRLFMVAMNDIYALMGECGPPDASNVEVLKVFQNNPLAENQIFQATREAKTGDRDMFLVQAGTWKGVISKDNDRVVLRTEINE